MRILVWHVHGSWTTALVQGGHEYVVPVTPDRGPDGRGRARTWDWPANVQEVPPSRLADLDVDVVVLQRPHEIALTERWTGRRPGGDVPAVFVEHNAPDGPPPSTRHPLAHQAPIPIAHVSHFNELFYDNGRAPTVVVEHGVIDPGPLYSGELARLAVVANDPITRGRTLGTDLIPGVAGRAGVDLFGMRVTGAREHLDPTRTLGLDLAEYEDLPQAAMHVELARRRAYLHLTRWTSLGLSLIEAMTLGMPVIVLATTEAVEAVAPEAGALSTDLRRLQAAASTFLHDPEAAAAAGAVARTAALRRFGLSRFLSDWDALLKEVTR